MQSLKYYKLQFIVLITATVSIVFYSYFFFFSQQVYIDFSVLFKPEMMIVKNIKEKAVEIGKLAKNCEELKYFSEEFAFDIKNLLNRYGYYVNLKVLRTPCELPNFPNVPGSVEMLLEIGKEDFYHKEIITFGWP
jgi:hypothetical protein